MPDTATPALTEGPAAEAMRYAGELTVATSVSNLDDAVAWYADVLGFELLYKLDDMRWAEMQSPVLNVQLGLGEKDKPEVQGPTPVWSVQDIDAARKYLESKDVRFDGDTMEIPGMVKLATFFDPDGNSYMLSQSLQRMGG